MVMHMAVHIDYLLRLPDSDLVLAIPEHGDASEVRTLLHDEKTHGRKFLPIGNCDNFDPEHGCKGHTVIS